MAITLDNVKRGGDQRPTIDLIYAPPGMGKTTLAAGYPDPIFIQTEDGLGTLEMPTFGLLKSYEEVGQAMGVIANQPHDFKTLILDSAGWLEPLIWDKTCRVNGWANIEAPGWGKGAVAALEYWRKVLDGFNYIRNKGIGVKILAHAGIGKQELPDTENFDQYQPKLNKRAADLLQEYAENVYFINTRVSITRSNAADKNSRGLAVGSDQRFVYTSLKPSHIAKNRFNMPAMIPLPTVAPGQAPNPQLLFATVAQHIPYYRAMLTAKPTQQVPAPVAVESESLVEAGNPFDSMLGEVTEQNTTESTETNDTNATTTA